MVIVLVSGTGDNSPGSGIINAIAFGFCNVVVKIKKVIKRNARSTIAVRSIRVDALFALTLPPLLFPLSEVANSAMISTIYAD